MQIFSPTDFTKSLLCTFALLIGLSGSAAYACDVECEDTIDALSEAARKRDQSVAQGRNNSVVMQYGAGVPVLKCRPLNFCSIQLQPGEVPIEDLALGDTVLWSAEVRVSGSAAKPTVRILIKPDQKATQTSLLVATNKRFYDIQLLKSETDYTNVLAFTYPQETAARNTARIAQLNAKKAATRAANNKRVTADHARKSVPVGKNNVYVGALDFNYKISGKTKFKPVRVFNDGHKTYLDLPDNYRGEKPVFLASGPKVSNEIVNSRWAGNRLTIDRVFDAGTLVQGVGGRAQKITITRR
jgi:type IV secretion system protein VirB9